MLSPALTFAQSAAQIQKCQDATGQWHYGSRVNSGCQSSISDLNFNGITINQSAPFRPATGLQVLAIKQQQASDQQLLQRHSSQLSIEQEKQRKISGLVNQQSINLEIIEKMGIEIQTLRSQSSASAKAAFRERLPAIRQYLKIHESLSQKIKQTNSEYNLLISDYLQAQSRSKEFAR